MARMTTRTILTGWLTVLAVTACASADGKPGSVTAAGTGANRLAGVTAKTIDVPWGDGRRTKAFNGSAFNYFPVLPAKPAPDTLKDMTITSDGQVTIRYVDSAKDPVKGDLSADERKTFASLSQNVTFDYRTCPWLPGPDQPRYTWQELGTNHEFRPACPGNPSGMTMVLAPEVATGMAGFVKGVTQRLAGKAID
jgi:hypothetical protein